MATYPTLPTTYESSFEIIDGIETVRATNGSLKVRKLAPADKRRFMLIHKLTSAQRTTLHNFYGTNAELDVTYVDLADSASYTVRFVKSPVHIPQPHGWFMSTAVLEEV